MPALGTIEGVAWYGGSHDFRLATYGELRMLQEKCGAGPQEILGRLINGTWRVDDPREIIRLGLIGAGMPPKEAQALVRTAVDETGRWLEFVMLAKVILMAGLTSAPKGDPVGKPPAGNAETDPTTPATTTAGLPSPPSMETAPQSA